MCIRDSSKPVQLKHSRCPDGSSKIVASIPTDSNNFKKSPQVFELLWTAPHCNSAFRRSSREPCICKPKSASQREIPSSPAVQRKLSFCKASNLSLIHI